MAALSDILTTTEARARADGYALASLPRGLVIIIDYRDPAQRAIRFGRLAGAWPSGDEIAICRRAIDIPPGADMRSYEQGRYNVVAYTWPVSPAAATEQPS